MFAETLLHPLRTINAMDAPSTMNPAQRAVIELLGKAGPRPVIADDLADELRGAIEESLAHVAEHLDSANPLWVSKHALSSVHGCEARFLAGEGTFEWTLASVRGTVVHKAIEYIINWRGEPVPAELVDEAISRIVNDEMHRASRFVGQLDAFDLAELRGVAVDMVTKFVECFPPLKRVWRPVTEGSSRAEFFDGGLVFAGRTDLTLGLPGDKVIIDIKSGRVAPAHREDLRFYALVELLRMHAAPRKVATYYLDAARAHHEDVTESSLRAATRRTIDAVERIAALKIGGEEPTKRPGPHCRWCPLQHDCDVGRAALARADDPDNDEPPW